MRAKLVKTTNATKTISFHMNGFWFHVNKLTGKDQKGERWFFHGSRLVHEHGVMSVNPKEQA